MTRPKVVDLRPPANPPTGYRGRVWDAERMQTTGRWALVGRLPGSPNSFTDVVEVRYTSNREDPGAIVRDIAAWLNDRDETATEGQK